MVAACSRDGYPLAPGSIAPSGFDMVPDPLNVTVHMWPFCNGCNSLSAQNGRETAVSVTARSVPYPRPRAGGAD
jgi:hypothetical protein